MIATTGATLVNVAIVFIVMTAGTVYAKHRRIRGLTGSHMQELFSTHGLAKLGKI